MESGASWFHFVSLIILSLIIWWRCCLSGFLKTCSYISILWYIFTYVYLHVVFPTMNFPIYLFSINLQFPWSIILLFWYLKCSKLASESPFNPMAVSFWYISNVLWVFSFCHKRFLAHLVLSLPQPWYHQFLKKSVFFELENLCILKLRPVFLVPQGYKVHSSSLPFIL